MIEIIRDPLPISSATRSTMASRRPRIAPPPASQTGALKVSARQAGNQILIEVADDGRGIDGDALVRKARAAGLLSAEQAEKLSAAQKIALVFAPGLSTRAKLPPFGRGVGMDVVAPISSGSGGSSTSIRGRPGVRLAIRVRSPHNHPGAHRQLNASAFRDPRARRSTRSCSSAGAPSASIRSARPISRPCVARACR